MLDFLQEKYKDVPIELKKLKRWICYRVEGTEDGRTTKRPYNAMSGKFARVNDDLTWATFNIAISGCAKYHMDGLGFILGDGIFGIDLDNHADENGNFAMSEADFLEFSDEFVESLDSYAELSQSGKGIHIICYGKLPEGGRRHGCVEMYDSGRFFAFTGKVIHNTPINERTEQIVPLWEKYINSQKAQFKPVATYRRREGVVLNLSDQEVIDTALASKQGSDFYKFYHDGDISCTGGDHSKADMSFMNILAFWCNGDSMQMDRIFRNSAMMRDKWDEYRGSMTYGEKTISIALQNFTKGYEKVVQEKPSFVVKNPEKVPAIQQNDFNPDMNIDANGEPIFRIKKIFKRYPLNDTGNASKFCDYFGEYFKYNVTDKVFMFWTGKTWIRDDTNIIRKYADKFIEILKNEEDDIQAEIDKAVKNGDKIKASSLGSLLNEMKKNSSRISNKAGKDAMLYELQHLGNIAIHSGEFNKDDYLLNTDSGIVDLRTGKILPFDREKLISKNTNVKVSYEEPTTWLKFLYSVFDNGDIVETQKTIDSIQTCLGYSLSGSTKEQVMFLLYGCGSNGKSTLTEQVAHIMGDYGDNIQSSVLMQQKAANNSSTFSIAKLQTVRFVETGETDDGGKLAEAQIKILTGGDSISAQFKFGNEFAFRPKFKIWMSTNNKPIIRGTDDGIWRRIFLFPFLNSFKGPNKDKTLPDKLRAESEKILGWCIKGFLKYQELGDLIVTDSMKDAVQEYKDQMDVVAQFLARECLFNPIATVDCKALYARYKEWANNNTEFAIKESKFSNELKLKGITTEKNPDGTRYYKGIKMVGLNIG